MSLLHDMVQGTDTKSATGSCSWPWSPTSWPRGWWRHHATIAIPLSLTFTVASRTNGDGIGTIGTNVGWRWRLSWSRFRHRSRFQHSFETIWPRSVYHLPAGRRPCSASFFYVNPFIHFSGGDIVDRKCLAIAFVWPDAFMQRGANSSGRQLRIKDSKCMGAD